MQRFAKRLKTLRKEHNFTQKNLADILGYARTTIANYEQAARFPPIDTLFEIANFFDVSLDYLLGRTKIKNTLQDILLNNFNIPILIIDPQNGKIIDFNDTALNYYGYSQKEMFHKNILEINQLDQYIISQKMKQVLAKKEMTFSFPHKLASGEVRNVIVFSGPVRIDKKTVLYSAVLDFTQSDHSIHNTNQAAHVFLSIFNSKFPFLKDHHDNVVKVATSIAYHLNLAKKEIDLLAASARIHDISFLHLPTELLSKPSFTEHEYNIIKEHPGYGYELFNNLNENIAQIIEQHHERLDGSGYPDRLKDEQIRIEARVLAVADVFAAMNNKRPYRDRFNMEAVCQELIDYRGSKYDQNVVDACLQLVAQGKFDFLKD